MGVALRIVWNIMMAYCSIIPHFQDMRLNQVILSVVHIKSTVKMKNEKKQFQTENTANT
jgi:hypothetical protein